jgi:hypothetical protein
MFISKEYLTQQKNKITWRAKRFLDFSAKEKLKKISIIVTGRNDNYGGDFSKRLQTTLDWNLTCVPNHELIYVEWNRIKEKPSDCEWIVKQYANATCYIVPNEIHTTICQNPKIPMMEYFAKNIGIRKANCDWILLINSDIMIGMDTSQTMKKLSSKYIYGTHYVNLNWNGNTITHATLKDKKNIKNCGFANRDLSGVVGNFILSHRENWLSSTGYDETLTNVRAGVDNNGLHQLLHLGLKPMLLGHHFHLDHPESIIHGANHTHGENKFKNIPYKNPDDWGFKNYPLKKISERIWELQPI